MDRCPWAKTDLYVQYHDTEWGVPVHDDRLLFEFLILEGAQAGLSWETILNKRENYRAAFDQFDPAIVAKYGQKKRKSLLSDAGIVRNRHRHHRAGPGVGAMRFAKWVFMLAGITASSS
jgi:DNA-3-methyladenine glycosylase I